MGAKLLTALLLASVLAIAFGVNWMAYEQMRANSGIFIDPRAMAAPEPAAPEPAPTAAAEPGRSL